MNVESTRVRYPAHGPLPPLRSRPVLLPTTTFCVRLKAGSPDLGVSGISPAPRVQADPARTPGASQSMPYFSQNLLRRANVDASAAVGPGADHIQIVADHIGQQQRYHRRRITPAAPVGRP